MSTPTIDPPKDDYRTKNLIYYIDDRGVIVWTNRPFAEFAEANGAPQLASTVVGTGILNSFSGGHNPRWESIYHQLINGRISSHSEHFSCPSPTQRREYTLNISSVEFSDRVFLRHETILLSTDDILGNQIGVTIEKGGSESQQVQFTVCQRSLKPECGDGVWTRNLDDGRVALIIADAMGHGPEAAAALSDFFQLVEAEHLADLQKAIIRINRQFTARPLGDRDHHLFITGLLMIADPKQSTLTIACFGHDGVILSDSGPVVIPGGLPIGIIDGFEEWPLSTLDLASLGSRLLAYTDGITEQFNLAGDMYGIDNLTREFKATSTLPLNASLSFLMKNLDHWRGEALLKDDQTLLGVDIKHIGDVIDDTQ